MLFENSLLQSLRSHANRSETSFRLIDLTLFLGVVTVLGVVLILSPPIWQHGEAREGLVVQSILRNHQWILPLRNGELPSKPLLFHWTAAVFALLLGFSDTIVRLPSLIGAMIMIIATFSFAKKMHGHRTAWLAVAMLLGTNEFWDSATEARVDMIFSAAVTTSLAAWFSWYGTGRLRAQFTCYLAVACAVLVKGPAGMVLPGAVILGFLWMEGELRRIINFWSWPLAAGVMFLDLGWYSAAFFIGGEPFVMKQIVAENIDRFVGTGNFSEHQRTFAPLLWLATRLLPWNIVLLVALVRRLRGEREDSAGRFLHAWWSIIFMIFFLAAGQRAVYLLPIYPAVALLAARAFSQWLATGNSRPVTPQSHRLCLAWCIPAMPKKLFVLAATVALINLALAIATPIARWSKMERGPHTAFIERTAALIPKGASVEADPSLPETDLVILAYRLNRPIPREASVCQGNSYYLAKQSALPSCLMNQRPLASTGQDGKTLVLMGPMDHLKGSSAPLERRAGLFSPADHFSLPAATS